MPSAVEHVEQALDVVGGVDHDGLARLPIADQVDEVDHLAGDRIRAGEVASGEQLAEVQPVVHILCTLWRGSSMRSASMWAACWWSPTTACSAAPSRDAGIAHDRSRFGVGHYLAMAAMDRAASDPEDFTDYLWGFVAAVGVPEDDQAAGARPARRRAADPGLVPAGAGLAARACGRSPTRGVRLAVTSNSDGTVADHLARHEWVQVGEGPGRRSRWSPTRGSSAWASPTRACSRRRSTRLGLAPERILHVGDSVHYDVDGGARRRPADGPHGPLRACAAATDHPHVRTLGALLDLA